MLFVNIFNFNLKITMEVTSSQGLSILKSCVFQKNFPIFEIFKFPFFLFSKFPISKYFSKFQNLFQTSKIFQNFIYVICQYFQFQFANQNGSHKLLGFVDAQVLCIVYLLFLAAIAALKVIMLVCPQRSGTLLSVY